MRPPGALWQGRPRKFVPLGSACFSAVPRVLALATACCILSAQCSEQTPARGASLGPAAVLESGRPAGGGFTEDRSGPGWDPGPVHFLHQAGVVMETEMLLFWVSTWPHGRDGRALSPLVSAVLAWSPLTRSILRRHP